MPYTDVPAGTEPIKIFASWKDVTPTSAGGWQYSPGASSPPVEVATVTPARTPPIPAVVVSPPPGPSGSSAAPSQSSGPSASATVWKSPSAVSGSQYTGQTAAQFLEGVDKIERPLLDLVETDKAHAEKIAATDSASGAFIGAAPGVFASHVDSLPGLSDVVAPFTPSSTSPALASPSALVVNAGIIGTIDINPLSSASTRIKPLLDALASWIKAFFAALFIYTTYKLIFENMRQAATNILATPSASEGALVAAVRSQIIAGFSTSLLSVPLKVGLVVVSITFLLGVPILIVAFLTVDLVGISFGASLSNISGKFAGGSGAISVGFSIIDYIFPVAVWITAQAYYFAQSATISAATWSLQIAVRYLNSL
jgi:hypothetical protein